MQKFLQEGQYYTALVYLLSNPYGENYPPSGARRVSEYSTLKNLVEKTQKKEAPIRIKLLCNWCSSEQLREQWNKMSARGDYSWGRILVVVSEPIDYWVVINSTTDPTRGYNPKKTLVFRMEPNMHNDDKWGQWSDPISLVQPYKLTDTNQLRTMLTSNAPRFLRVFKHETRDHNNIEWHISKSYRELLTFSPQKSKCLSTVLSEKYKDLGQIKRIDFVKFLERKGIEIDVYGNDKWHYKNYKGSLPYQKKDNALFPYKYTFNCENNSVGHYFTEKLIDGILSDCLVFYSGCPNIADYIDSRAYVYLQLSNFEKDYEIVKKAIEEDWWTQRLPYIQEAKRKILNELQFFPRLEREVLTLKERERNEKK